LLNFAPSVKNFNSQAKHALPHSAAIVGPAIRDQSPTFKYRTMTADTAASNITCTDSGVLTAKYSTLCQHLYSRRRDNLARFDWALKDEMVNGLTISIRRSVPSLISISSCVVLSVKGSDFVSKNNLEGLSMYD
jgi:hypothetical protein